jgi:hypothetical protein
MLVWSRHNICTWYTRYKYYPCFPLSLIFFFFFFFFNFVVCKLCQKFPFIEQFFSRIHTFKTNFPNFFKKKFSHSAKIHQEKSLFFWTQFLLFFHSRFICYDPPCNFSFSPKKTYPSSLEAAPKNFGIFTVVQV